MGMLGPFWPQGWTLVLTRIHAGAVVGQGTWVLVFYPGVASSACLCGPLSTSLTLAACFDLGRVTPRTSS